MTPARSHSGWVPLAVILTAQLALSLAMITHIPSSDEGRYIYAGHQLIYELWHGGGSPYYETYFSGAPVIYCPLAAMADHLGGIIEVRLMSVTFMLVATVMLFGATRRLFGYGAALAAAGLFAATGLTHAIGVYANYDAMALMLLSVAAYCAVRAGALDAESRWLILAALALVAANATKYASLAFDVPVIALYAFQAQGWRAIGHRALSLGAATGLFLVFALVLAGTSYAQGLLFTTLNRPRGANAVLGARYTPASAVLSESGHWIGPVLVLGAVAFTVTVLRRQDWRLASLLAVLLGAGMLVTIEAVRLHSDESMGQHDDFGAWFTCIAAGYILAALPAVLRHQRARVAAGAAVVALVGAVGVHYAQAGHVIDTASGHQINTGLRMDAIGRPYLTLKGARYLVSGGFAQMAYTDHVNIPWWNLGDDNYIKYPIPGRGGDSHGVTPGQVCTALRPGCVYLTGSAGFRAAIRAHWFAFISLFGRAQALPQDRAITQAVEHTPGYMLLTRTGNAPTWIYRPAYR